MPIPITLSQDAGPSSNFEVSNAVRVVFTADNAHSARLYARTMAPKLGELVIDEVTRTITETRKRVTTVRPPKLTVVQS